MTGPMLSISLSNTGCFECDSETAGHEKRRKYPVPGNDSCSGSSTQAMRHLSCRGLEIGFPS